MAIAVSAGLGGWVYHSKNTPVTMPGNIEDQLRHATYLYAQNTAIADFDLIDQDHQPFGKQNIKGKWTLWFFGFTHCPDICPTTLGTLSAAVNVLITEHNIRPESISIVFVSVDPQRDHSDKLKAYVNAFSQQAIGVTAEEKTLAPFLKNMGIIATRQKTRASQADYLVDHSSSIYLIAPDTAISALFGAPHRVENIVQDFLAIKKFYR